jgi:sulfur carrier protein
MSAPPAPPIRITVNGRAEECPAGTTVAALVARLEPARARACAVEVNLALVPRSRHAERRLDDGDRVEIVTLVGGG